LINIKDKNLTISEKLTAFLIAQQNY